MANSGQTGSSSNIRIRGAGSLSGGYEPVFYVDGIRIESGNIEAASTYQGGNALDFLNPDDIESIEVIKGPAAATLYGADAANGVIQIITKKGRETAGGSPVDRQHGVWRERVAEERLGRQLRDLLALHRGPMQNSNTYPGCQVVAGNRDPAEDLQWWGKDSKGDPVRGRAFPEEDIIRIPGQ
jgi:TonB-dependent SusC/RagA subfamily outer membrane receptor